MKKVKDCGHCGHLYHPGKDCTYVDSEGPCQCRKAVAPSPVPGVPPEVLAATENLMLTCRENGITVAGFVFSANPICLLNFGTCNDAAELPLYEALCRMVEAKQEAGTVQHLSIGRKQ